MFSNSMQRFLVSGYLLLNLTACGLPSSSGSSDSSSSKTSSETSPKPVITSSTSSGSSTSASKRKTQALAAIRRDIQSKKDEMLRNRQDLNRYSAKEDDTLLKIREVQVESASTTAQLTQLNGFNPDQLLASGLSAALARYQANQRIAQLNAQAELLKKQLEENRAKIKEKEDLIMKNEQDLEDLNQLLNDTDAGTVPASK